MLIIGNIYTYNGIIFKVDGYDIDSYGVVVRYNVRKAIEIYPNLTFSATNCYIPRAIYDRAVYISLESLKQGKNVRKHKKSHPLTSIFK